MNSGRDKKSGMCQIVATYNVERYVYKKVK